MPDDIEESPATNFSGKVVNRDTFSPLRKSHRMESNISLIEKADHEKLKTLCRQQEIKLVYYDSLKVDLKSAQNMIKLKD